MSCRITADNQVLSRTTNLPAVANVTFCFWIRLAVDRNTNSCAFEMNDVPNGGAIYIETGSDGTTLNYSADGGGVDNALGTLTVGSWYFAAVTRNGNNYVGYLSPAGGGTLTSVATVNAQAYTTFSDFTIGKETFNANTFLNGNLQCFKMWAATLTQAELELEMRQQHVVRTANINAWYPLLSATNDTKDLSGNAFDMTAGAANPATEDGPPVSWLI